MRKDYLLGFRVIEKPPPVEVISRALREAGTWIESYGALLEGWDYDESEGLILVHLKLEEARVDQLKAAFTELISKSLGQTVEKAIISPKGDNYVKGHGILPSPSVMGFLLRAARQCKATGDLAKNEVFVLLLFYMLGGDLTRVVLASSFFNLDPSETEAALHRLSGHYIDIEKGRLLKLGEKLLDYLITNLRVRPVAKERSSLFLIDEGYRKEAFSVDKLVSSLYLSGVPYRYIPEIVNQVANTLHGKKFVSRKALASVVRSLIEDMDRTDTALRFYAYIYALDRVYVLRGLTEERISWSLLRRTAYTILSKRDLKVPSSLAETLAELIADKLRETIASEPWKGESIILNENELIRIAEDTAPLVSRTWAELHEIDPHECAYAYKLRGSEILQAAKGAYDFGERKDLILKGLHLVASGLLLELCVLPSNRIEQNLGMLRAIIKSKTGAGDEKIRRYLSLSLKLARSPTIVSPRENRQVLNQLDELLKLDI